MMYFDHTLHSFRFKLYIIDTIFDTFISEHVKDIITDANHTWLFITISIDYVNYAKELWKTIYRRNNQLSSFGNLIRTNHSP